MSWPPADDDGHPATQDAAQCASLIRLATTCAPPAARLPRTSTCAPATRLAALPSVSAGSVAAARPA
jgi:hypothetical protein